MFTAMQKLPPTCPLYTALDKLAEATPGHLQAFFDGEINKLIDILLSEAPVSYKSDAIEYFPKKCAPHVWPSMEKNFYLAFLLILIFFITSIISFGWGYNAKHWIGPHDFLLSLHDGDRVAVLAFCVPFLFTTTLAGSLFFKRAELALAIDKVTEESALHLNTTI